MPSMPTWENPPSRSYATELGTVYDEIRLYLRKLRQWARPRRAYATAHFLLVHGVPLPFGVAAVLSPWNYRCS